ncbi:MAG: DUF1570 domain-containing protein [bacterium]|nr:DUF1570 domain-containing protein [bacterium]
MKKTLALLFATLGLVAFAPAQKTTKDDEDVLKAKKIDPYTKADPALMKQAGIVGYGPFPWADYRTTDDLEAVLGKGRFLWIETEHFKIGYNLKTRPWPEENEKRRYLKKEIKEVRKKLPKFPSKPKKFGPWVQIHLYAWRLENLYRDFQKFMGVTDADFNGAPPTNGKYLGMGDKYLVLMFEKRSDLARYFDRFCNTKADVAMRWYHLKTHQLVAACAAEGLEGFDLTAIHSHIIYSAAHNLISGFRGFHLALPLWLDEGLAHHFAVDIPSSVANVSLLNTEAIPELKINAWPVRVRKRAQHEGVFFTFDQMCEWKDFTKMGYHHHAQAWSRVDYLAKHDAEKLAFMVRKIKEIPPVANSMVPHKTIETAARRLLIELFELDAESYDKAWRAWVLKTYPKK